MRPAISVRCLKALWLIALLSAVTVHSSDAFSQHDTSPLVAFMWSETDKKIVEGKIDKEAAAEEMKSYLKPAARFFMKMGGKNVKREQWVFPLANYSIISFRDDGNDFRLGEYDYFQGSNSKGHPAHDIMILDADKNLLDDSTGQPVDVVSMGSGLVFATDSTWEPGSTLRGGKYVKIYDVTNNGIFYYSHLSKVTVAPGMIVDAGEKIGEVGRTGRKAIFPAGKTHLHVAYLKLLDDYPVPEEIIKDLRRSEKQNSTIN